MRGKTEKDSKSNDGRAVRMAQEETGRERERRDSTLRPYPRRRSEERRERARRRKYFAAAAKGWERVSDTRRRKDRTRVDMRREASK